MARSNPAPSVLAFLADGRTVHVPLDEVDRWRDLVESNQTNLGLGDFYVRQEISDDDWSAWNDAVQAGDTREGLVEYTLADDPVAIDKRRSLIGEPYDSPRCQHPEQPVVVTGSNYALTGDTAKINRFTHCCQRRACLLDALAWVERSEIDGYGMWRADRNTPFTAELPAPGSS